MKKSKKDNQENKKVSVIKPKRKHTGKSKIKSNLPKSITGGAPLGHPLWGNPVKPKYYSPDELWLAACEYFEWAKQDPIIKKDFIKSGDYAGQKVDIELDRPFSLEALCIHINISFQTFLNYERDQKQTYFDVITRIREIINVNNFDGGMVGIFNQNIVIRKLGLTEKIENENKNIAVELTSDDIKKYREELKREIK